jgi:hypothetical protein
LSRSHPIQNITTVTQVGYRYAETRAVPATHGANVYANRGLCVPENKRYKIREAGRHNRPRIFTAPNHHERNLSCEFIRS